MKTSIPRMPEPMAQPGRNRSDGPYIPEIYYNASRNKYDARCVNENDPYDYKRIHGYRKFRWRAVREARKLARKHNKRLREQQKRELRTSTSWTRV